MPAACACQNLPTLPRYLRGKTPTFQSQFTHAAGAVRLTSHPGGFIGLWKGLAGRKRFPVQYLIDAGETLQEFVARGDER